MSRSDGVPVDSIDLSEFEDEFRRSEPPAVRDRHLDEIPDGFYDARVEDVKLGRVRGTGNPMLTWRLRILGPRFCGAAISKVRIITHQTVGFLKDDLSKLGLEMGTLDEMTSRLDEMVDRPIGIMKRARADRRSTDLHFVQPSQEPVNDDPGH